MVTTGFTLACLTGAGFFMIFRKLPGRVRKFMQKHVLFTDAITCVLTYALFGGTLVALFAAAWMGLIVSMLLALTSNPSTNALMERYAQKMSTLKDKFIKWAESKAGEIEEPTQLQIVK